MVKKEESYYIEYFKFSKSKFLLVTILNLNNIIADHGYTIIANISIMCDVYIFIPNFKQVDKIAQISHD